MVALALLGAGVTGGLLLAPLASQRVFASLLNCNALKAGDAPIFLVYRIYF